MHHYLTGVRDQRVYGASLLDITPTVLAVLGRPVARDMDGRPLKQIFDAEQVQISEIDTYEDTERGSEAVAATEDPWVAPQVLARLVDLGYIENDSTEGAALDRARNLGQIYASRGRPRLAIEQYEQVLARKPDDQGCKIIVAGDKSPIPDTDGSLPEGTSQPLKEE